MPDNTKYAVQRFYNDQGCWRTELQTRETEDTIELVRQRVYARDQAIVLHKNHNDNTRVVECITRANQRRCDRVVWEWEKGWVVTWSDIVC
jgi:hypothetical protein